MSTKICRAPGQSHLQALQHIIGISIGAQTHGDAPLHQLEHRGTAYRVAHVALGIVDAICNGKLLMKDRELVGIDEEAVNARILEESKKLWGELNHCEY